MKLAIVGSRSLTENRWQEVLEIIDNLDLTEVTEIVSGGANGIDAFAERFAAAKGLKMTVFKPDYERFGMQSLKIRNGQIIRHADKVLIFWDGQSSGTIHARDMAQKYFKPFEMFVII